MDKISKLSTQCKFSKLGEKQLHIKGYNNNNYISYNQARFSAAFTKNSQELNYEHIVIETRCIQMWNCLQHNKNINGNKNEIELTDFSKQNLNLSLTS